MTLLKFSERLYIGHPEAELVSASCLLSYQTPGSANIITKTQPTVGSILAYECGYNNKLTRYFTGYIESFREINDNQYSIFARELSGLLRKPLPMTLQHVTLPMVLEHITSITGLQFTVPERDYSTTVAPYVINHSTGYALLDQLGNVFDIERYTWQQLGNGHIFVGSWYDSAWAQTNIPLPTSMFEDLMLNRATIPLLPKLRPGVSLNGQRVRSITTNSSKMVIEWMTK